MSAADLPALDFEAYHRETLSRLLADGRGAEASRAAGRLGSLAVRLEEGGAWTYRPRDGGLDLVPGDEDADTVIELSHEIWQNVVHELDAPAGLLYGQRARCPRGKAIVFVEWEPALRCLYNGRPVYDPEDVHLWDRHGAPLDPEQTFRLDDDPEDMAHFLRTAGYLFVRDVFAPEEIAAFLEEARELRGEARKGDNLSWWGKSSAGEEVLCRVTRAGAKPRLHTLPTDPRIVRLKDLADEPLEHRSKGSSEEGVSVIYKNPDMAEGLSDIPWHRDCGMGGHSILCPILIFSTYLTPANPETGELEFLPGSWDKGCGPIDPGHPRAPRGAHFDARPGDVTLHYGDTMHAAPPPARSDLEAYRISAVTGFTRPGVRPHRGRHYNEVLHRREDGQVEHLSKVAEEA
ncbi:MAG: phytanoyl-CoA dioxygenase family protein [Myxococcota bacterium]